MKAESDYFYFYSRALFAELEETNRKEENWLEEFQQKRPPNWTAFSYCYLGGLHHAAHAAHAAHVWHAATAAFFRRLIGDHSFCRDQQTSH